MNRQDDSSESTGDVLNLCPDEEEVEEIGVVRPDIPEARVVRRRRPDLDRPQVHHA